MSNIGKLSRVPLREVWKHEAHDFTQWMEVNIDDVNTVLPFDIVNVDREQAAGSFSVDLVGEDTNGRTVIIENQLEKSNHDHLGKLITYLTAMNASSAIWVVSEPRPEHVAALTWLNDASTADFYLLKVEAVKIGDSAAAALFTVIVSPSEDTTIRQQKKQLAERYVIRHKWWTQVTQHPEARMHAHITPGEHSWIGVSAGISGFNLNYSVTQHSCSCELYIDRGKGADEENKQLFDQLYQFKAEIESAVNFTLLWERLDVKRASRIKLTLDGGYRSPEEEWPEIHNKLIQSMTEFTAAIKPKLKLLDIGV